MFYFIFKFLSSLKIMDYSLLIGIHSIDKAAAEQQANEEGNSASPQPNNLNEANKPDSDQDNFSPTEDTEDTDDDQLNGNIIFFPPIFTFILFIYLFEWIFFFRSSFGAYSARQSNIQTQLRLWRIRRTIFR